MISINFKENEKLHNFLIGSRFGDGAFVKKSENHNTYIVFKHSDSQYDYLKWKYDFLKNNNLLKESKEIKQNKMIGCYQTTHSQYYFSTKSFSELNYYKNNNFTTLFEDLDWFGLIIWIFDDGSFMDNKICKLTLPNKTLEEKYLVVNTLSRKFKLDCYIYEYDKNHSKDNVVIRGNNYQTIYEKAIKYLPENIVKEKMNYGN